MTGQLDRSAPRPSNHSPLGVLAEQERRLSELELDARRQQLQRARDRRMRSSGATAETLARLRAHVAVLRRVRWER